MSHDEQTTLDEHQVLSEDDGKIAMDVVRAIYEEGKGALARLEAEHRYREHIVAQQEQGEREDN